MAACVALLIMSAYAVHEWRTSTLSQGAAKNILLVGVITAMFAVHQFGKAIGWKARGRGSDGDRGGGESGLWPSGSDASSDSCGDSGGGGDGGGGD